MKNVLIYNYNLEPENLIEQNSDCASFYVDYVKYFFFVSNRPKEDIENIYQIINSQNLGFHKIIINNFNAITTPYRGKEYVLVKINGPENNEIDIQDMMREMTPYSEPNSTLTRTNWGELWSAKVDYLEYQISELGMTHKIIRHSFSYYVGLAENAIEYFNLLSTKDLSTVIAHKRIKSPLISREFYDPLDIVIDFRPRDYASYFKIKFFDGHDALSDVKLLVEKNILTPLEYNLLFCRLLYPSYYFDGLHEVLENGKDDDYLLKYIDRVEEYEIFLRNTYEILKSRSSMLKIEWLIKKS